METFELKFKLCLFGAVLKVLKFFNFKLIYYQQQLSSNREEGSDLLQLLLRDN